MGLDRVKTDPGVRTQQAAIRTERREKRRREEGLNKMSADCRAEGGSRLWPVAKASAEQDWRWGL
eukprot:8117188-Pyramimonas_sp.AAC.1